MKTNKTIVRATCRGVVKNCTEYGEIIYNANDTKEEQEGIDIFQYVKHLKIVQLWVRRCIDIALEEEKDVWQNDIEIICNVLIENERVFLFCEEYENLDITDYMHPDGLSEALEAYKGEIWDIIQNCENIWWLEPRK